MKSLPFFLSLPLAFAIAWGDRDRSIPVVPETSRQPADALRAALNWLSQQQDADGYWGSGDSRALLTSVSLLAFLLQGETPMSWEHGLCVSKGLRALIRETSPETIHPPDRRALLVWSLSEAYGLTRIPIVLESLKSQAVLLDFKSPTPWHSLAADSLSARGANPELARQAFLSLTDIWTNQTPDLVNQAALFLIAHRQRNVEARAYHLEALRRLNPDNWQKHPTPLISAVLLSQALLRAGGKDWARWSEQFFPFLAKQQLRSGKSGWWTAESLNLNSSECLALPPESQTLFITACLLLAYPPSSPPPPAL